MKQKITPLLMFEGTAEAAMNLYVSLFDDASIGTIVRYGKDGPGAERSVMFALMSIAGQQFMCLDSAVRHAFTFTPSLSLYVDCATDEEITRLAERLGEGGSFLMPLGSHPFARKFAWLTDRFGVSGLLSLQ